NTTVAGGPITSGLTRGFNVVGASLNYSDQGGSATGCGIPGFTAGVPAVQAIAVNVVAVNPTGQGNLRAFPGNLVSPPLAATLNYQNFSDISHPYNIANGVIVPVNQVTGGINKDLKVFASTTT